MNMVATSVAILLATTTMEPSAGTRNSTSEAVMNRQTSSSQSHPYIGMWVTGDGKIRHELLPNGRYDEARNGRKSAYQGRYEVTGSHIDYWDDTGFTADGKFVDDVLHHGGMIFYRE